MANQKNALLTVKPMVKKVVVKPKLIEHTPSNVEVHVFDEFTRLIYEDIYALWLCDHLNLKFIQLKLF